VRPLPRAFYARHATRVARDLLGRLLVRVRDGEHLVARILEVEAYRGADDPASHAHRGRTPRNAVMFGPPGHAYVYFTYGMHHCLNLVCEPEGRPAAVLLRALEPVAGLARMRSLRGGVADLRLLRGPGCLARGLAISLADNGADLTRGALFVADVPAVRGGPVHTGSRVGIRHGRERSWRFALGEHPGVSRPRPDPAATGR
jgi:DNA-3-methyladenine glycosylase